MTIFESFVSIIKRLRAPGGCLWDMKQSPRTLTSHIIEEAYELVEAIETNHVDHIREELGDVLLHVVMIANMMEEQDLFDINTVIQDIRKKMIRRHPHVFSDTSVSGVGEVLQNWEDIKKQEKKENAEAHSSENMFDSLPSNLPALIQANKIQKIVARLGFDWGVDNTEGPAEKICEELQEVRKELDQVPQNSDRLKEEIGDLLFSSVNLSRKAGIDPEDALRTANRKFIKRFQQVARLAESNRQDLKKMTIEELDQLWEQAKKLTP